MTKLDCCPWCHNDDALRIEMVDNGYPKLFCVRCDSCGGGGPFESNRKNAASSWNDRRPPMQRCVDSWNEYADDLGRDEWQTAPPSALDLYSFIDPCKKCGSKDVYICDPRENDVYASIFIMCQDCRHEAVHPATQDVGEAIMFWNKDDGKREAGLFSDNQSSDVAHRRNP